MSGLHGSRTYVGFGFGPIQAGLFLYEAYYSRNFKRLVVGYRRTEIIDRVRAAGGMISLNIAHPEGVKHTNLGPIEIYNTNEEEDRRLLIEAIAQSEEMATALSSVADYVSEDQGSIHRLLARGLQEKGTGNLSDAIIYTAENHSSAAEILTSCVLQEIPERAREVASSRFVAVNTVIEKLSNRVPGLNQIRSRNLVPLTPTTTRRFLLNPLLELWSRRSRSSFPMSGESRYSRTSAIWNHSSNSNFMLLTQSTPSPHISPAFSA